MSGVVNRVNKTSDKTGEEKMRNIMIISLLAFMVVACKSEEPAEVTPAVEEAPVETLKEEVTE